MRTVFFISDRTGITAEALGNSLLTQFHEIEFMRINLAFIDTQEKLNQRYHLSMKPQKLMGNPH